MNGLSHGVIRVDTEEKLSVLTVQDVGQVMPGGKGWDLKESRPDESRGHSRLFWFWKHTS